MGYSAGSRTIKSRHPTKQQKISGNSDFPPKQTGPQPLNSYRDTVQISQSRTYFSVCSPHICCIRATFMRNTSAGIPVDSGICLACRATLMPALLLIHSSKKYLRRSVQIGVTGHAPIRLSVSNQQNVHSELATFQTNRKTNDFVRIWTVKSIF